MAFILSESVAAGAAVKTASVLNIPVEATLVELQADTNDIRYTMDDATDPTQTSGMVLVNGNEPELFLVRDVRKIRFTRGAASDGNLNLHYACGRIIVSS